MNIKIGRAVSNDYIIDHPSVSNEHALIEINENNEIFIRDLNSSGGTFINGVKVLRKKIELTETITLGQYEVDNDDLKQNIDNLILSYKTDFTEEFNALEPKYKDFIKKINKVERDEKNKQLLIRLAITVVLMVITYFIFGELLFIFVVGIVSGLLTNLLVKTTHVKEKKEIMQLDFSSVFVCPKCKTGLIRKSWIYWSKKGECPNVKCDATWH